ncbi:hypothetical protein LUZ63_013268 [Rhynchospora breviuscula]|uniref:Pectinesterase inhibitor domain-containing protein n=1 Tax=Rhynchospora breviuscula TaxID=2022672 RepID=A0A9Q0HKH3_9POAL|nr:hypothetical protein LUZ63_013268 [Rhynchospora breviuscula]
MNQTHSLVLILNLTLLCMVAIHGTTGAPIQSDFIRSSCKATHYPALCVQSLMTYAPSVRHSPRQLAQAALTVSLTRARSTSAFINQLSPKPDQARSRQAGAIKDCLDTMQDGVDRLRQSIQEMNRMGRIHTRQFRWHLSNVQTWVSAALTDENTCLDSVSHNAGPAVRAAVRQRVVEVAQVTSNALALVNRLAPRY